MRLKIVFNANVEVGLPINYNYYLTSFIYKCIEADDKDFSEFLHEEGYKEGYRHFKFFTYSFLRNKNRKVLGDKISFKGEVEWYFSSIKDDIILHFVNGLFKNYCLEIQGKKLDLCRVECIPKPDFKEIKSGLIYECLSPLTISKTILDHENKKQYFIRPDDEDYSEKIKENLIRKYKMLYSKEPENQEFNLQFLNYKNESFSKLIDFKGTKIKSYLAPLKLSGNPELIEVGYETGFGDKNSAGFGMVSL